MAIIFRQGEKLLSKDQLSEWAISYGQSRALISEIQRQVQRSLKYKLPVNIDPNILGDLENSLARTGSIIREGIEEALPEGFAQVMETARGIQRMAFTAAKASGTWVPGSPLGYLPRFFSRNKLARIEEVLGGIEAADSHLLTRLGVSTAQYHARTMDSFTIDDLNDIYIAMRESATETGSEVMKEYVKDLDEIMQKAGVGVPGLKHFKLPWTKETIETDPFLALI